MGCSFDRIGITIDKKENIKTFVEIFNREMEEHLYCGSDQYINEEEFEEEFFGYYLQIEEEPIFAIMEAGAQLIDVVYPYLEAVPDCEFSLWFEATYNNCGAINYTEYKYKDHVLKIVDKDSEESGIGYCPECEWDIYEDDDCDEDSLCTIDEWDPNEGYKCPQCGAALEWDVCINERVLRMVDGKLVKIKDTFEDDNEYEDE